MFLSFLVVAGTHFSTLGASERQNCQTASSTSLFAIHLPSGTSQQPARQPASQRGRTDILPLAADKSPQLRTTCGAASAKKLRSFFDIVPLHLGAVPTGEAVFQAIALGIGGPSRTLHSCEVFLHSWPLFAFVFQAVPANRGHMRTPHRLKHCAAWAFEPPPSLH